MIENNLVVIVADKYGHNRKHVEVVCKNCSIKFFARKDWVEKGCGNFCSPKCKNEFKKQKRVVIKCDCCGKEKEVLPRIANRPSKSGFKFCSLKCRNESTGIGRLIHPPHYGTAKREKGTIKNLSPDGKCLFCKKELNRKKKQFSYCSSQCQRDYHYAQYIEQWKKGEVSGNESNNEHLNHYVRRYMLLKANNRCQKCGWCEVNPKSGKVPVTINHIDGDSTRSVEENLEVLCPNCHSLTPTYGSLNKGKGRKKRLQKYYDNKNEFVGIG